MRAPFVLSKNTNVLKVIKNASGVELQHFYF